MINVLRVGYSVLRYRGGIGQWAWAINRAAGLGIVLFLALHIFGVSSIAFNRQIFEFLDNSLYKGPVARVLIVLLVFGLLHHGLNGIRLIVMDFVPRTAKYHIQLFYAQLGIFLVAFIPASAFLMSEYIGWLGGAIFSFAILIAIVGIALAATYLPFGGSAVDVSGGNYDKAISAVRAARGRAHSDWEFYSWLFMRVSAIIIVVLAFIHMVIMHFVISVSNMSGDLIVQRWSEPGWGVFWRSFDLILLVFAFTHGMAGTRNVIDDYLHAPGWRVFVKIAIIFLWGLLLGVGALVIFTFNPATLAR